MQITTRKLASMKEAQEKIAMVTAYDYPSAQIAEQAGADLLLVGDSLGMVVLGYQSTIPVTMEDILHHTKAVSRAANQAMVVADLPFLTVHLSVDDVLRAAAKLLQEGNAYAVKAEGGEEILPKVQALTQAGIPVMGHIGLTPQSVNQLGGFFVQGKDEKTANDLIRSAKRLEEQGAFALVLECVPEELGKKITEQLTIPVIGIGAGRYCDGQVLVYHDLLGMGSMQPPSFVKQYASIGESIRSGIASYVQEVKQKQFPTVDHIFPKRKS